MRIAQKVTQELLPFWQGHFVAEFEDIRPTDTQARLDEIKTAYSILSINEIRQRYYRLPAVAWGVLPVDMKPASGSPNTSELPAESASLAAYSPVTAAAPPSGESSNKALSRQTGDILLPPESLGARAQQSELNQWERFALKRLGKPNTRSFEARALPDEVAFEISAGLLVAADEDAVKAVFIEARNQFSRELQLSHTE